MSESKSEIRNLLISAGVVNDQADFIENNLNLKFYIIPKDSPPEKWIEPFMEQEWKLNEPLSNSIKLKWRDKA